jgi:hypothetical protein
VVTGHNFLRLEEPYPRNMGSVILGDMRSYIKKTGGASSFRHQEPPGDIGTLVNTLQL